LHTQRILEEYNTEGKYEFHWLSDPDAPDLYGSNVGISGVLNTKFNALNFVSKAVKYVKDNQIEGLIYFHDFVAFLSAIVCQEAGIRGPSVESAFLSNHKYYSRKAQPVGISLWFEAIDLELDKDDWSTRVSYPCVIKPPCMFRTTCIHIVNNESEMLAALASCRTELTGWSSIWRILFEKYVDIEKYPLALKDIVVAEELVPNGTQHTIEGWADGDGKPYIWLTTDTGYHLKPSKTMEGIYTPSQLPKQSLEALEEAALAVAKEHLLKDTFFNVELWYRDGGRKITVTEINNRAFYVIHNLYEQLYGVSSAYASLHLACGEYQEVHRQKLCICEYSANRMGGYFLLHVHLKQADKATEIIDFQAAKAIGSNGDNDVLCNTGPGVNLVSQEDDVLQPVGTFGALVSSYNIFKPNLREVLEKADEIREVIIKRHDVLPQKREPEYYNELCGIAMNKEQT